MFIHSGARGQCGGGIFLGKNMYLWCSFATQALKECVCLCIYVSVCIFVFVCSHLCGGYWETFNECAVSVYIILGRICIIVNSVD